MKRRVSQPTTIVVGAAFMLANLKRRTCKS
jgi:hypothetical protein